MITKAVKMLPDAHPSLGWHPRVPTIAPVEDASPPPPSIPSHVVLRRIVVRSSQSREWELQDENSDLRRQLQDSQQIVSCLQSERDELRTEVTELQAQLSYATGTLTAQFRKGLEDLRAEDTLHQRLKDQNTAQSNAIKRLTAEASGQYNTINQLKGEIKTRNTKIGQLRRDRKKAVQDLDNVRSKMDSCKPPKLSKAAKRKQHQEAAMLDVPKNTITGNEGLLISKFVQDSHLTDDVLAQISRIAANVEEKKNTYDLLYSGNRGIYYCIHEAVEKGKLASQALSPAQSNCPTRGANCNFMVKVITVVVSSKFQVFNPKVSIPNIQQSGVQSCKSE